MSEWAWVAVAYVVTYAALATFSGWLLIRIRRTRERLEELR